jgi:hypothetical protein
MKRSLLILILTLSFQSWTKADDIKDFEIEGMSIGDSALKYFKIADIKKRSWEYPGDKKFIRAQNDNMSFFKTYDAVDFSYKSKDKSIIIHSLSGIFLTKNMNQCIKKQNVIANDLTSSFPNAEKSERDKKYKDDHYHWKGTRNKQITFWLKNNGGTISVHCTDYSEDHGGQDHLSVNLKTKEINDWLINKAYKK